MKKTIAIAAALAAGLLLWLGAASPDYVPIYPNTNQFTFAGRHLNIKPGSVVTNPAINGVTMTWPGANASGNLQNDGSGNLIWGAGDSIWEVLPSLLETNIVPVIYADKFILSHNGLTLQNGPDNVKLQFTGTVGAGSMTINGFYNSAGHNVANISFGHTGTNGYGYVASGADGTAGPARPFRIAIGAHTTFEFGDDALGIPVMTLHENATTNTLQLGQTNGLGFVNLNGNPGLLYLNWNNTNLWTLGGDINGQPFLQAHEPGTSVTTSWGQNNGVGYMLGGGVLNIFAQESGFSIGTGYIQAQNSNGGMIDHVGFIDTFNELALRVRHTGTNGLASIQSMASGTNFDARPMELAIGTQRVVEIHTNQVYFTMAGETQTTFGINPGQVAVQNLQNSADPLASFGYLANNVGNATALQQQFSPGMTWAGSGWSTVLAAPENVYAGTHLEPILGSAHPTGLLSWTYNIGISGDPGTSGQFFGIQIPSGYDGTGRKVFASDGKFHDSIASTLTTSWSALNAGTNYAADLSLPYLQFLMTTNVNLLHATNGTANFTTTTTQSAEIKVINNSGTNFPVSFPTSWKRYGSVAASSFTLTNGDWAILAIQYAGVTTDQTNIDVAVSYRNF